MKPQNTYIYHANHVDALPRALHWKAPIKKHITVLCAFLYVLLVCQFVLVSCSRRDAEKATGANAGMSNTLCVSRILVDTAAATVRMPAAYGESNLTMRDQIARTMEQANSGFDNALVTHLSIQRGGSNAIAAIIAGITNGVLSADKAIDCILPISTYAPSDVVLVCDTILNLHGNKPEDVANTVDIKASVLNRMGNTQAALTLCCEYAKEYEARCPYGVGLIMCEAGGLAKNAGKPAQEVFNYYEKARAACDPRRFSSVRAENYGYASYEAAGALLRLGKTAECKVLIEDALAALQGTTSWKEPLERYHTILDNEQKTRTQAR